MGEISLKQGITAIFHSCLIKITITSYCCVEFLNLPNPPVSVVFEYGNWSFERKYWLLGDDLVQI